MESQSDFDILDKIENKIRLGSVEDVKKIILDLQLDNDKPKKDDIISQGKNSVILETIDIDEHRSVKSEFGFHLLSSDSEIPKYPESSKKSIISLEKENVLFQLSDGQNILHIITSIADCRERKRVELFQSILDGISDDEKCKILKETDTFGNSILHYAAMYKRKNLLKWLKDKNYIGETLFLENHEKMTPMHFLAQAKRKEFVELCKELKEVILNNKPNKFSIHSPLHEAASCGSKEMTDFLSKVFSLEEYISIKSNEDEMTPLHFAIAFTEESSSELSPDTKSRISFLLENTPSSKFRTKRLKDSPIHVAARYGKPQILMYLLNYKENEVDEELKDKEYTVKLSYLMPLENINGKHQNVLHVIPNKSVSEAHVKCVKLLLNHNSISSPKTFIRICFHKDSEQKTPLDYALHHELVQICSEILRKLNEKIPCTDPKCLWLITNTQNQNWPAGTNHSLFSIPLRKLFREMPDALLPIFDTCIKSNNEFSRRKVRSSVNIISLVGKRENKNFYYNGFPESEFLQEINAQENSVRNEVLEHVLVQSFIREKWKKVKKLLYVGFTLQMLHIIFFTLFSYFIFKECNNDNEYNKNSSKLETSTLEQVSLECDIPSYSIWETFYGISTLILSIVFVFKELYQIFHGKDLKSYLFCLTNWIQWIFILATLSTTIYLLFSERNEQIISKSSRAIASIGVIFGGILTLYEFKKIAEFGAISRIFKKVAWKSAILLSYYLMLIITFMVAFRVLTPQNEDFTFPSGIVKILAMMVGEYEFEEHFEHAEVLWPDILMLTKLIVFTTFIFVAAIVGLNLLIGLAVDDIQALKEDANMELLATKLDQIYATEKFIWSIKPILPQNIFVKIVDMINLVITSSQKDGKFYKTKLQCNPNPSNQNNSKSKPGLKRLENDSRFYTSIRRGVEFEETAV